MTALRREAIQLVEQMPEEHMPYIIEYIRALKDKVLDNNRNTTETITPKMTAFFELEKMIVPALTELDYDKELAEARDEKYGYFN
ncbi:MAG: UDP-N-acetylenolpyruvoylglucosamine reductase [Clostridium sp.]|nr:UDP-N-acetylenolpyruvoylglucosamine reductase [Clostridium sp.]